MAKAIAVVLLQAPSETDLMKAEIAELRSENATDADKVAALQRLRSLVEPLDNANGTCQYCAHSFEKACPSVCICTAHLSFFISSTLSFHSADLKVLGGITPLFSALSNGSQELQAAAASVLGTAASNNVVFQQHVAEQADIIPQLLQVKASWGCAWLCLCMRVFRTS